MPDLLIRNLDPDLKAALAARAKANGRSLSKEADQILRTALAQPEPGRSAWDVLRKRFEPLGGVDLDIPRDRAEDERAPPSFD